MKRHRSLLHELTHTFKLDLSKTEKIPPVTGYIKPKHIETQKTNKNREEAIKQLKELKADILIFIDGSAQKGKVGAAAIL